MTARQEWHVLSIKVRDRFGDHGLVGVAITHDEGERCEIDTLRDELSRDRTNDRDGSPCLTWQDRQPGVAANGL